MAACGESGPSRADVEQEVARQAKARVDVPSDLPPGVRVDPKAKVACAEKEQSNYVCDVRLDVSVKGESGVLAGEDFGTASDSGQVEAVADSDRVVVTGLDQFGD